MRKQQLIIQFLLIPIISLFFLFGVIPSVDAENPRTLAGIYCEPGTELSGDKSQCVPSCSDGTNFVNDTKQSCELTTGDHSWLSDSIMLMLGIVIAAVATGFGLALTWKDRKNAANQRKEELVQTYSNELREISNQELGLKTKQECALYAEQYLDTVEKISTLHKLEVFDDNIMKYFENNFTYAIDLWNWYNYNVHGIDYDTQDEIWKISKTDSLVKAGFLKEYGILSPSEKRVLMELWSTNLDPKSDSSIKLIPGDGLGFPAEGVRDEQHDEPDEILETVSMDGLGFEEQIILKTVSQGDIDTGLKDFFTQDQYDKIVEDGRVDELKKKIKIFDRFMAFRNYLSQDRWPDLRQYMVSQKFTDFAYNFRGIGGRDNSEENWRVLPDIMYYDYKKIPDEDGLTKSELVEIIRPFANDLSKFVEQEKSMTESEEFEVYAEQYLETLEQIATLYRTKIIPTKASEYFENKFSYGCNLWDWYHRVVLKFSKNLHKALWETVTEIKLEKYFTKNEIKEMKKEIIENFPDIKKEKVEEKIKDKKFDQTAYKEFIDSYSINDEPTAENLSEGETVAKNLTKEDPDVWKLITLAANSKIIKLELTNRSELSEQEITELDEDLFMWRDLMSKSAEHAAKLVEAVEKLKKRARKLAEELTTLRVAVKSAKKLQAKNTQEKSEITTKESALKEVQKDLTNVLTTVNREDYFITADVNELLNAFVSSFLDNERWEDFRWWCKNDEDKKVITPFQEDEDEGLILPLKMWEAYYD